MEIGGERYLYTRGGRVKSEICFAPARDIQLFFIINRVMYKAFHSLAQ